MFSATSLLPDKTSTQQCTRFPSCTSGSASVSLTSSSLSTTGTTASCRALTCSAMSRTNVLSSGWSRETWYLDFLSSFCFPDLGAARQPLRSPPEAPWLGSSSRYGHFTADWSFSVTARGAYPATQWAS